MARFKKLKGRFSSVFDVKSKEYESRKEDIENYEETTRKGIKDLMEKSVVEEKKGNIESAEKLSKLAEEKRKELKEK